LPVIFDRGIAPNRQIARRRDKPPASVAEEIPIGRYGNIRSGEQRFGNANVGRAVLVD
jgi:hypothetical protein